MTQLDMVRKALANGEELTALDALDRFGCMRLGARVHELKREGFPVRSRLVTRMNRHGEEVRVAAYSKGVDFHR